MPHPDDIVRWPDGTEATWGEVEAGEYHWMSDDYEIVPITPPPPPPMPREPLVNWDK